MKSETTKQSSCPSCKCDRFEVIDAGRLARCCRCRWLLRPTADGGFVTAIPEACRSKPKTSRKVKTAPTDLAALDRLLRGG